ncbi:MAG: hypothetical protein KGJ55_02430 [Gammaproteobacteria bacterium]|nr:hypothetical protein [Gammaproteobacteria bacterium]
MIADLQRGRVVMGLRDHPLKGKLYGWRACEIGVLESGRSLMLVCYVTDSHVYLITIDAALE